MPGQVRVRLGPVNGPDTVRVLTPGAQKPSLYCNTTGQIVGIWATITILHRNSHGHGTSHDQTCLRSLPIDSSRYPLTSEQLAL